MDYIRPQTPRVVPKTKLPLDFPPITPPTDAIVGVKKVILDSFSYFMTTEL